MNTADNPHGIRDRPDPMDSVPDYLVETIANLRDQFEWQLRACVLAGRGSDRLALGLLDVQLHAFSNTLQFLIDLASARDNR